MLETIRQRFTRFNAGAKIAQDKGYRAKVYECPLDKVGRFSVGLFQEILKVIVHDIGIPMSNLRIDPKLFAEVVPNQSRKVKVYDKLKFDLRYYQKDAVKEAITTGRGIILHATGAGKTISSAVIAQSFTHSKPGSRVLMIVPNPTLMEQTFDDFIEMDAELDMQKWGVDDPVLSDKEFIMTSTKFLIHRYKEDNKIVKDFDVVICDECHGLLPGNKLTSVVRSIKTHHKFGFTGTLPENDMHRWGILGLIGGIAHTKKSAELRKEGYLAQVHATCINIIHPPVQSKLKTYHDELDYIFECEPRNKFIGRLVLKMLEGTTLIMYHKTVQGENIYNTLCEMADENTRIHIIKGDVSLDDRQDIKEDMRKYGNCVVVANSKIFSTGLSINEIMNILFVDGGKAYTTFVQSVGRGLRLDPDKERLNIFDISDNLEYSQRHFAERCRIYNKEHINFTVQEVLLGL